MVSAIILNYLNPELTAKSVMHLNDAAEVCGITPEIIVVDNSAPRTAKKLWSLLPETVKIIENEENMGFSRANNQGIQEASGEIILAMNNDLFINAEVLQYGIEYLHSHKNTGIWAPKLTDQSGHTQRSCAKFPTLKGIISEYLFNHRPENGAAQSVKQSSRPVQVDSVIGACMFIPEKILKVAGTFDEDYFFCSEDVDLCYRIKALGYNVIFDPRCAAVHLYGASQNYTWYNDPYMHKSRKLFFKKHYNPFIAASARFFINTGIMARKIKHKFD